MKITHKIIIVVAAMFFMASPVHALELRDAKAQGKTTIGGLEMFVEQAAAQFEIWTGDEAPRKLMRRSVLEVLEGK